VTTPLPRRTRRSRSGPRLWTFGQAKAALPYLVSVVRSLREHSLECQSLRSQFEKLEEQPGRPDRRTLITLEEIKRQLLRAEEEVAAAIEELAVLNIHPQDAIQGQVLLPFLQDDQPAWMIFDLFDSQPIRFWRYYDDTESTRRRLSAAQMN
jgi:hypothetical protein